LRRTFDFLGRSLHDLDLATVAESLDRRYQAFANDIRDLEPPKRPCQVRCDSASLPVKHGRPDRLPNSPDARLSGPSVVGEKEATFVRIHRAGLSGLALSFVSV
jgi:hypothetical protein